MQLQLELQLQLLVMLLRFGRFGFCISSVHFASNRLLIATLIYLR